MFSISFVLFSSVWASGVHAALLGEWPPSRSARPHSAAPGAPNAVLGSQVRSLNAVGGRSGHHAAGTGTLQTVGGVLGRGTGVHNGHLSVEGSQ